MSAPPVDGFVHEVGFYASDAEFADIVVPFAEEGRERGEPVVFAYDERTTSLLTSWLPADPVFTYVTDRGPYASPAKALDGWRRLAVSHLDAGAARVRIAGTVPHPGYGVDYHGWDRYEAALDRALGDLPVWAPCLYDARIAPAQVLDRARSLHRSVLDRDGTRRRNSEYREPTSLADFVAPDPDPLEFTAPALDLADPTPAAARQGVRELTDARLSADQVDALVLAASEVVTNTLLHGEPPASVRGWVSEEQVIVRVHDSGRGPADPLTGLLDRGGAGTTSGRGLWITHQLDLDVALTADEDGFTVRLRARAG